MICNQVRALALALVLPRLLAVPALGSTPQAPAEQEEESPQEEPQEEDNAQSSRPLRRPGLLPLSVVAQVDLGSRVVGPALLQDESFVIATTAGEVVSLDATTLEMHWKLGMPGAELFAPCLLPSGVLIASRSGHLMLVRLETGEILREVTVGAALAISPSWDANNLFLATTDRDVMAYDLEKWEESWRTRLQDPPLAMTAGAGLLLVSDRAGGLHAMDAMTGGLRWQFQGRGNFEAPAVFDDAAERLYLGDTAGYFYSISTREGKVHYRWAHGAAVTREAFIEADRLFVASYANTLFCYRTGNGHELWRANLPGRPAAAPVRARRRVVVLTLNGQVVEYGAGGRPGPHVYASPEDILPFPTFFPQGMALPLRSGKLLLLRTRPPALPQEEVDPSEEQEDPEDLGEEEPSATTSRTELSPKTGGATSPRA